MLQMDTWAVPTFFVSQARAQRPAPTCIIHSDCEPARAWHILWQRPCPSTVLYLSLPRQLVVT